MVSVRELPQTSKHRADFKRHSFTDACQWRRTICWLVGKKSRPPVLVLLMGIIGETIFWYEKNLQIKVIGNDDFENHFSSRIWTGPCKWVSIRSSRT